MCSGADAAWGHGGWGHEPRFGGRPRWGDRRGHGALAAGALGLATGAIIGGAFVQPRGYEPYPDAVYDDPGSSGTVHAAPAAGADDAYCLRRFRSYDPASGTDLGHDGPRHPCP